MQKANPYFKLTNFKCLKMLLISGFVLFLQARNCLAEAGDRYFEAALRGWIYNESYNLGKGFDLGYFQTVTDLFDVGGQLEYAHYGTMNSFSTDFSHYMALAEARMHPWETKTRIVLAANTGLAMEDIRNDLFFVLGASIIGLHSFTERWTGEFLLGPSYWISGDPRVLWKVTLGINYGLR